MIETISTFSSRPRPAFVRRYLLAVTGIVSAFNIMAATCVEADVNLADIVCWQCDPPPDAQALAVDVRLTILPQLIQNDYEFAKRLGFDGAGEITQNPLVTDIGIPFVVFLVGLDRLQNYQPPLHDPASLLLDDTNWFHAPPPHPLRFLFPIKVGNKTRSAVMVTLPLLKNLPAAATRWEIQWIGTPNLMRRVATCGYTTGPKTCDGKTYFIVWIPALNRYYLGRFDPFDLDQFHRPKFKLTVLFKDRVGQEGDELLAGAVFQKLKPEALQILSDPYSPPR